MDEALLAAEPLIRMGFFLAVLSAMAAWEWLAPRRRHEIPRLLRWGSNLGLVALNSVLVRLVFPLVTVGLAAVADRHGWGLFNLLDWPFWLAIGSAVLALDLAVYLQHVMFHAVPLLWRLHRMHHADLEFDVTTGLRFHPVEIFLSLAFRLAVVAALGPPVVAVLIFEVLLNATSMFNHGNVRLPGWLDRRLRWLVVTPDMHRVHHSIHPEEANSNFGFSLPWWDRVLGTYRDQPREGHESMTIGIEQFRTRRELRLDRMLLQPLHGRTAGSSVNLRQQST